MSNSTKEPDASGSDSALKIPTLRQFVKGAGDFGEDEESEAIQAVEEQAKKFEEKKANEEISIIRKSIDQEKQKKKALMQLLLTGIVRCKYDEQ